MFFFFSQALQFLRNMQLESLLESQDILQNYSE